MPPILVSETDRRAFLRGAATLPLAAVLFHPELAAAQAARVEEIAIDAGDRQKVSAFIARPDKTPAPVLLLIHEWYGVNDQIKAVAREFADQGYIAIAVDLFGGEVATTPDEARALTGALDPEAARRTLAAWIGYSRKIDGGNGKVATIGWCFGGGWSLAASLIAPVDATVVYYGNVARGAEELMQLEGPVLAHFGTLDKSISKETVAGFEKAMAEAGKADELTVHWYEADHAFANPTGARYDAEDAALAWDRTLAFLGEALSDD
jgi:carboxymethylenebutenolidase